MMTLMLTVVLLYGVLQNALGDYGGEESLAEVMKNAAVNVQNTKLLKEKFLIPYVRNVYNNLVRLEKHSGNVRFLVPEAEKSFNNRRSQRLLFNTSEIVKDKTTTARLVLSSEVTIPPGTVRIACGYLQDLPTKATQFGVVADISDCLKSESDTDIFTIHRVRFSYLTFRESIILAVFNNFDPNEVAILESEYRVPFHRKRSIVDVMPMAELDSNTSGSNSSTCSVKPWIVDFAFIEWSGWLLMPDSYEANVCQGLCPAIHTDTYYNSSGYSIVKSYYHIRTDFQHESTIPRASCVPSAYGSLVILYMTKSNDILSKDVPGMVVKACKCA